MEPPGSHGPAALRGRGLREKPRWRCGAAFKCIMDHKQCAILCPTTILAWQHYQTALQRFEAYPDIRIDLLSRFRTPKQQQETLAKLKRGEVDLVIGTHRLVQKDVEFSDLGLAIIDEEQRFGVAHKERFKEMFRGVDVLTLSATPIPRTPEHGHERHPGYVGD